MEDNAILRALTCPACKTRIAVIPAASAWCSCGRKMAPDNVAKSRKCAGCGAEFAPGNNKQRFCPACGKANEKKKTAGRVARSRKRSAL